MLQKENDDANDVNDVNDMGEEEADRAADMTTQDIRSQIAKTARANNLVFIDHVFGISAGGYGEKAHPDFCFIGQITSVHEAPALNIYNTCLCVEARKRGEKAARAKIEACPFFKTIMESGTDVHFCSRTYVSDTPLLTGPPQTVEAPQLAKTVDDV